MLGINRPPWCEEDRTLAQALQIDDDSRCVGGGHYVDAAWGDDAAGHWEAESDTCHACAAVQRRQEREAKPLPGEYSWPVSVADGSVSVTQNPFRRK